MSFISPEEQERLIKEHLEYAKSGAKRYARMYRGRIDYDEFESVALFYLFYATTKWNPALGASFKSFAFDWIDGYMKAHVKSWLRANGGKYTKSGRVEMLSHRAWPTKSHGDDGRELVDLGDLNPRLPSQYQTVRRREKVSQLLSMCRTTRQKRVLLMLLKDKTMREIAKRLNVTPSAIQHHKAKILKNLGVSEDVL